DVDAQPARQILESRDRRDLPRDLVDRAGALLRIQAGMGGDAADPDLELPAPLAAGLGRASRKRRFEDEHRPAAARLLLDRRARRAAADFLVGGPQHDDVFYRAWG